jgi:hypothetical protein
VHLFQQLDNDWSGLIAGGEARRACLRWNRQDPALANVACVNELVNEIRTCGDPAKSDAILSALVRLAAADTVAARTVLQALVPGMRCLCRKLAGLGETEDVDATIVACAWERIRTYPHDRRPNRVAANVLLDTRKRTLRALATSTEIPFADLPWDGAPVPQENDDLNAALDAAIQSNLLTADEASLILATRVDGQTLKAEADRRATTSAAIGKRRARAEARLKLLIGQ